LHKVISDDFGNFLDFAGHIILICCYLRDSNIKNAEKVFDEIPLSQRFYPPIQLSFEPYGFLEIDEYFLEALDGLIAKGTSPQSITKARVFRAIHSYNARDVFDKQSSRGLEKIRDDFLSAIELWPTNADIYSYLSGVLQNLKDWVNSAYYHFLSRIYENDEGSYYEELDSKVLESIYEKDKGIQKLFAAIDKILDQPRYDTKGRFAERCLGQVISFLHSKQDYGLVIKLAQKFSYEHILQAESVFEVGFAYVETGDKRQGKNYYRAYLRDVGNSSAVANNLAILEEESGNLLEADRLLQLAIELDMSDEIATRNLARVHERIKKANEQQRAYQKAADLFQQEPETIKSVIAELYSTRTSDDLILCNNEKIVALAGLEPDDADTKLLEFIRKNYFDEITDHAIAFDGKVLRVNPIITPHLQRQLEWAKEKEFISQVSNGLLSESLDRIYGYNPAFLGSLKSVNSNELAQMLERDLYDAVIALTTKSYKSALILCGSIAEAILLDKLLSQRESAIQALERILLKAGKKLQSDDKQIERWNLSRLLDVALEEKMISENLYHWGHGLREFRNLVHPGVEHRKSIEISRENADMAWNVIRRLLKELSVKST